MRSFVAALAVYLGLASTPAIDVEQYRSDAACELVYCSLSAARAPTPIPAPPKPAPQIPRLDPPPPIPAAAAASATPPPKPAPAAPPKRAAQYSDPKFTPPPVTCRGGNCRPRRWFSRR